MPLFEALIEFIYKMEVPARARETEALLGLLKLADKFETASCVESCLKLLASTPRVTLPPVLKSLSLPTTIKMAPKAKAAFGRLSAFLGWKQDAMLTAEGVGGLPFDAVKQLFAAEWGPDCEELLFSCFLLWAREAPRPMSQLTSLLTLIRFPYMEKAFLENEVSRAPEMQTVQGQCLIHKARLFQGATERERDALVRDSADDIQFVPRATSQAGAALGSQNRGKHVLDFNFPIKVLARLGPDGNSEENVIDISPDLRCRVFVCREAKAGCKDDEGKVGVYVFLENPLDTDYRIVATYQLSLPDILVCERAIDHVFKPGQDLAYWGKVMELTWKELLFCEKKTLEGGNLKVRVTFERLWVY